jgi:hypothetical protein
VDLFLFFGGGNLARKLILKLLNVMNEEIFDGFAELPSDLHTSYLKSPKNFLQ